MGASYEIMFVFCNVLMCTMTLYCLPWCWVFFIILYLYGLFHDILLVCYDFWASSITLFRYSNNIMLGLFNLKLELLKIVQDSAITHHKMHFWNTSESNFEESASCSSNISHKFGIFFKCALLFPKSHKILQFFRIPQRLL